MSVVEKEEKKNSSVLGTFSGKCCDANVFNNNDMHLSRELFENLLKSDDYKRAMENHHYVGYLGHPENPDCQEYEHACIVMKDMRVLDNGEIEGDFDLVDTPVGRVVKSFIDAGVKFGISIRGLGDVDGNGEVDPDQFIFRGFDLVTFPAYDDCIPEFKAIAASTDMKKKAAFKKVCASLDANLPSIDDPITLGVIQEQFDKGSDPFSQVQERIDELNAPAEAAEGECCDIMEEKLNAMTELYLDAAEKVRELQQLLVDTQTSKAELALECKTAKSTYAHLKKITASQLELANSNCEDLEAKNERITSKLRSVRASLDTTREQLKEVKGDLAVANRKYREKVQASKELEGKLEEIRATREHDKKSIEASNTMNLKYQKKIEESTEVISQKDSTIEELKQKLNETVVANTQLKSETSNLGEKCNRLQSRVEASEDIIFSYQQAYANMYANALGVYLSNLPITASTSVEELKNMIKAGTSTAGIPAKPSMDDVEEYVQESTDEYEDDSFDDATYNAGMVTM